MRDPEMYSGRAGVATKGRIFTRQRLLRSVEGALLGAAIWIYLLLLGVPWIFHIGGFDGVIPSAIVGAANLGDKLDALLPAYIDYRGRLVDRYIPNLVATVRSPSKLILSWVDASTNEDGFTCWGREWYYGFGAWQPLLAGFVNGDGYCDFVLHHATTGQTAVWYMTGAQLIGGVVPYGADEFDTDWRLIGQGDQDSTLRVDVVGALEPQRAPGHDGFILGEPLDEVGVLVERGDVELHDVDAHVHAHADDDHQGHRLQERHDG